MPCTLTLADIEEIVLDFYKDNHPTAEITLETTFADDLGLTQNDVRGDLKPIKGRIKRRQECCSSALKPMQYMTSETLKEGAKKIFDKLEATC